MLSRDLLSASAVRSVAGVESHRFLLAQSLEQLKKYMSQHDSIETIVVDLQTPGLHLDSFERLYQETFRPRNTVAFAQHVRPDLLRAARSHFDSVLTRGQFLEAPQNWLAPPNGSDD